MKVIRESETSFGIGVQVWNYLTLTKLLYFQEIAK
jgi:hypothetical protein